ncbi:alkaline shock response membrane anchor protein AmaP [Streptomyces sp. NBC_00820]|uniref:alkaline shock response membrane anchor protein AmaP n=1 Tax=Streptomyces sp. NBC_00820 TaxID=2975842 RepID=UPI002ED3B9AA|nr:alkaline shock response membrane anchor protein AmaP [Streptomyces sp. NBC_00820]
MTPRPALNRILLGLAGLVLLGGGLLVLAAGLDVYRSNHLTPPTGWPLTLPGDVLLGSADRVRWSGQGWWWWPAVIAALSLTVLLALWWLLTQLHRHRPNTLPVGGTPPQTGVELRSRALGDAIAAEAGTLPGVQRAHVSITGRAVHPRTRVDLTLTPQGSPRDVLQALCAGPLRTADRSTGRPDMAAEARLRVAHHKARRAQ